MTSIITALGLLDWATDQTTPHITVNQTLAALAVIAGKGCVSKGDTAPPGSPAEGDAYILGASPTGAWSAFTVNNIAAYLNGGWVELTPVAGLLIWVDDVAEMWRWDPSVSPDAWVEIVLGDSADVVKRNVSATITVGYAQTVYDAGTKSSGTYTPDEANGGMQKFVNGGAHTLAPPSNSTSLHLQQTNNASAGVITTSGFTIVTGDALTVVDGDDFFLTVTKNGTFSHLHVTALQ